MLLETVNVCLCYNYLNIYLVVELYDNVNNVLRLQKS
jgi:hypothetical protein